MCRPDPYRPDPKRTLKTVFDTLGYTIPGEFPKSISKEEIIENKLKMIVALKLQICGKSSEAAVLYEEIFKKYPSTLIAEQALGQIKIMNNVNAKKGK